MRTPQEGLLFQSSKDLDYFRLLNREFYEKTCAKLKVKIFDRGHQDRVHGEDVNKTFNKGKSDPSYEIEGYVPRMEEFDHRHTKFGRDQIRRLMITFFYDIFEEKDIPVPREGDYIEVDQEQFKVMRTQPADYFGNTSIPLTLKLSVKTARPEVNPTRPATKSTKIYPKSSGLTIKQVPAGRRKEGDKVSPSITTLGPDPVDDGSRHGAFEHGKDEYGGE